MQNYQKSILKYLSSTFSYYIQVPISLILKKKQSKAINFYKISLDKCFKVVTITAIESFVFVLQVFQEIHDAFGTNTIKDCFIADIDFRHESFIYKAIACLCSFINHEKSAKPWCYQEHFDLFIAPNKNESLSLKDHRFNRVFDCCLHILHHLDDIKLYLDTYSNILNDIAIIDRSFLDMEILKPIFCAAALVGIHFTRPYLSLLLDTETTYNTLLEKFPMVYNDFLHSNRDNLLQADEKVVNFVSLEKFEKSLPKKCLRDSVNSCAAAYTKEVKKLLIIILQRLANGFSEQRGALFGFGPKANEDTKTLLKVSTVKGQKKQKLQQAPIHNLNEERSVGFVNYEIQIRGKRHLSSVSTKMVINKSIDLLKSADPKDIKKYRKAASAIKELKLDWSKKVREQRDQAFTEKEKKNLKYDSDKYELMEELKKEKVFPGPFVSDEEVQQYLSLNLDDEAKNKRLYKEVRYARMSSMSLKPTASVFRLKRNYQNLSTEEYADNLSSYLCSARSCKTITINDLNNIIHSITEKETHEEPTESSLEESDASGECADCEPNFIHGEHIVAFWFESDCVKWHLGIVEGFDKSQIRVSYMTRSDASGTSWTFPETAEVLVTSQDQILASKIKVQYSGTVRIRCKIVDNSLIAKLNDIINNMDK